MVVADCRVVFGVRGVLVVVLCIFVSLSGAVCVWLVVYVWVVCVCNWVFVHVCVVCGCVRVCVECVCVCVGVCACVSACVVSCM